jgi:hypothetical protein
LLNPDTDLKFDRKLVTRWLWNVDAVKTWAAQYPLPDEREIFWWSQEREDDIREQLRFQRQQIMAAKKESQLDRRRRRPSTHRKSISTSTQHAEYSTEGQLPEDQESAHPTHQAVIFPEQIESILFDEDLLGFVGQGREIGYCGLAHAVLRSVYDGIGSDRRIRRVEAIVQETITRLAVRRARSWGWISIVSLALVWLEIGMAFMISYNTATVGLACRSGSYIVYGCFSTIPWLLHALPAFKYPNRLQRTLIHFFNLIATLTLFFIVFAQVGA